MLTPKPWGYEKLWAFSEKYVGKIMFIKKGHALSKQYHEKKDESILVLEGILSAQIGKDENITTYKMGKFESLRIRPGTVHRFFSEEGDCMVVEVSTPELEDVVRLEDNYGRK